MAKATAWKYIGYTNRNFISKFFNKLEINFLLKKASRHSMVLSDKVISSFKELKRAIKHCFCRRILFF